MYRLSGPIKIFAVLPFPQNKVVTSKMFKDLFWRYHKLPPDLKLARPFDKKIDFGAGSNRFQFCKKPET